MKHQDEQVVAELRRFAALAGVDVSETQAELLAAHIAAVLEANERVNLTRIVDPMAGVRLHAVDSLTAAVEVVEAIPGPLLDLGTGAGFPGLPLGLVSGRRTVLLDSVGKKARELERIVAQLGLDGSMSVSSQRAEAHARTHRGLYAVVTARAVSTLAALVELASPLLMAGGSLVAMKGSPLPDEETRARAAGELAGMKVVSRREFELPEQQGHRTIIVYAKTGNGRVALPRREGLAQHTPLA